jgi:hypothetical protein
MPNASASSRMNRHTSDVKKMPKNQRASQRINKRSSTRICPGFSFACRLIQRMAPKDEKQVDSDLYKIAFRQKKKEPFETG